MQLLERNASIFKGMIPQIVASAPDAVLVVATNPVDIMTHLTAHYAAPLGVPRRHVIGSGTTLDTARFRSILGRELDVDSEHVHGYVVGEHGDSEVLAWSMTTVGTVPLEDYAQARGIELSATLMQEVDDGVRRAAYRIIEGKGSTYYGIGAALARIVQAIVRDQRSLLTVSVPVAELGRRPRHHLCLAGHRGRRWHHLGAAGAAERRGRGAAGRQRPHPAPGVG